MIKIVLILSLVLPLIMPAAAPLSVPHESDCASVGSQDTTHWLGEILEDDINIVVSSPLAESFHDPIDAAATGTNFCCCENKSQRIPHKKVLPLYKLQGVLLI
jgi:hypothetical protein